MVEVINGQTSYKFEGKDVSQAKLLNASDNQLMLHGTDNPICILAGESVTISTLLNLKGVLQKSGFETIKIYFFSPDRRMMAEMLLGVGRAIPYSKKGTGIFSD